MSRALYDYETLKREYIQGDMSLRELCRQHDIKTWSTVADRARRDEWEPERARYQRLLSEKTVEALTEKRARKLAAIDEDILETIHVSILKMGLDLQDRWEEDKESGVRVFVRGVTVTPNDLAKLIDKVQLLKGLPTSREAHLGLGLNIHADADQLPAELLRELAQLARAQGAGAGPVGQSPLPLIEGAKQVN